MSDISYIILFVVLGFLLFLLFKFFKFPKFSAVTVITGGVKSGKSGLTVGFAVREYRRAVFKYHLKKIFAFLFRRAKPEKPLLYSNIPLRHIDFVPVTTDILLRKKRIRQSSVVILDEASLVADSMLIKDKKVNVELLLFFKLFGHMSHGGKVFVNTHCISDLHYAMKRCTSTYFYVHHLARFPFVSCFNLREERYSDDGSTLNVYSDDVDKSLLRVLLFNRFFKFYDCYCYSCLTDALSCSEDIKRFGRKDDLKTSDIVSFRRDFQSLISSNSTSTDCSEDDHNA